MKTIRDFLKQLNPPKHLARDFAQENLRYSNRAFSYFSILLALLFIGGALAMGLFSATPHVQNYTILRIVYLLHIGISLLVFFALTYINRQKTTLMWLTNPITICECAVFAVTLAMSTHFEIADGNIKRIEILMMMLFIMVFLCRYSIWVTIGLQTAFTLAFVIQLCFEEPLISNFLPCLTNLIATYFICLAASALYAAFRVRNFTDRKNLEALVSLDFLTSVHNRRGFEYVLQIAWKEAYAAKSNLSLFMIDIDNFKEYNDFYGHQEGDKCLAIVAKTIANSVRNADVVARYGGEEFAVILLGAPREAAERIAERMFDEMEQRALPNENAPYPFVTFSIGGVSCCPAESDFLLDEFVRKADEALYIAKSQGKNRIVFHPNSL